MCNDSNFYNITIPVAHDIIFKFTQNHNYLKTSVIIYVDVEYLLEKISSSDNDITKSFSEIEVNIHFLVVYC